MALTYQQYLIRRLTLPKQVLKLTKGERDYLELLLNEKLGRIDNPTESDLIRVLLEQLNPTTSNEED